MNSNRKFNVSLDGTLLSHTTNPFTFHCRNLKCQTTGGQKISTSGFHFRRPGRQRSRCLRSLLHWVSERYVSLFKLWTVYSWLTFQFSTVPGPDLKCMAASWMSLMGVLFTHGLTNNVIMFLTFFLRETEGTLRSDNGNTSKNATEKLNSGPNSNYFSSKLSSLLKIGKWSWRPRPSSDRCNKIYRLAVHLLKINT